MFCYKQSKNVTGWMTLGTVAVLGNAVPGPNTWGQAGDEQASAAWVMPVNTEVNQGLVAEEAAPAFREDAEPLAMTEALFLGVSCEPVGEALAAQLPVPRGVGLLVTHVVPKSPAERAGLKTHDVLVKLNEQWLINPGQLAVLVRMQEDGLIDLHIRRAGEDLALTPQLELREVPVLGRGDRTPMMPQMMLASRVNQKRLAELQGMLPRVESDGGRNLMLKFKDQEHGFRLQMPEEGDGRVSVYGPEGELLQEFNLSELEEHIEDVLHTKLLALHEHLEEMDLDDHLSLRLQALERALKRTQQGQERHQVDQEQLHPGREQEAEHNAQEEAKEQAEEAVSG